MASMFFYLKKTITDEIYIFECDFYLITVGNLCWFIWCVDVDLLLMSNGERISPLAIEREIKKRLPCVSNCLVIGQGQPNIAAIMTLKVKHVHVQSPQKIPHRKISFRVRNTGRT